MITEYDFVQHNNPTRFGTECDKMIGLGWIPQGGISISVNTIDVMSQNELIYAQAFVWEEEE